MLKLAVPTRSGQVDAHFGGPCETLTIYEFDDDRAVVGQERFTPPRNGSGGGSDLCALLQAKGVGALIAGEVGEGAAERLRQAGIEVFRGVSGDVAEAVRAWTKGSLKSAPRQ